MCRRPTEVNAAAARLVLRLCGNVNDSGAAGAEPSDMEAGSGGDTTATTTTSNASNTTPTGGDDNGDNGADGDDTTGGGGGGGGGDDSGGGDGGSGGGGAGGGAGAGGGGGDDSASGGSGSDAAKDGEHPIVTLTKPYLDVMKKRLRLIVWDFDKTVLSIHSFHERISVCVCVYCAGWVLSLFLSVCSQLAVTPRVYVRVCASALYVPSQPEAVKSGERDIRADWGDLDAFVALSRYLKAQGFIVAVASFGIYETIQVSLSWGSGGGMVWSVWDRECRTLTLTTTPLPVFFRHTWMQPLVQVKTCSRETRSRHQSVLACQMGTFALVARVCVSFCVRRMVGQGNAN